MSDIIERLATIKHGEMVTRAVLSIVQSAQAEIEHLQSAFNGAQLLLHSGDTCIAKLQSQITSQMATIQDLQARLAASFQPQEDLAPDFPFSVRQVCKWLEEIYLSEQTTATKRTIKLAIEVIQHQAAKLARCTPLSQDDVSVSVKYTAADKSFPPKLRDSAPATLAELNTTGNNLPHLTHRTVCTLALAACIHRNTVQLEQLHIELASRFGNTNDIDAKIADTENQIKTWQAAIAWLDRVPGVY